MFPNPQDALPLPPRPNFEQYKKRAKDLLKASHSDDPAAIRAWAGNWIDSLVRLSALTITSQLPVGIDRWTHELEKFARQKLSETCTLSAAQFIIARAQGFESWPRLASHLEATARANSPVNHFELAVDAIVIGDIATLEQLLQQNSGLIRAHSTRRHQATLLHYISANGVEGYRQKTPPKNSEEYCPDCRTSSSIRRRRQRLSRPLWRIDNARPGGHQPPSRTRRRPNRAAATPARSRRDSRYPRPTLTGNCQLVSGQRPRSGRRIPGPTRRKIRSRSSRRRRPSRPS